MIKLPKFYPITDARLSGLSHAEQVKHLIAGGATLIQLREKHLSPREFRREAEVALRLARGAGVRVLVNDRADIALAVGADGVHLGQDDMPPRAARSLLGPEAVIGFSTHNPEQAREAALGGAADYIAIGPVFATSTKANPDPVVGLDGVRRVRELVGDFPLVAIGGITPETARAVLEAGADSVAVIGALVAGAGGDPPALTRRTRAFLSALGDARPHK